MRTPVFMRAILSAATVAGCFAVAPASLGTATAEAKGFYTRKRVNGEWITGHFRKRRVVAVKRRQVARAQPGLARKVGSTGTRASAPPISDPPRPERGAVPEPQSSSEPLAPLTTDERLLKLQEALQAKANSIVTTGSTELGPRAAALPALEQAASIAPSGGPTRAGSPPREPRSVSLDFETGVKTTQFSDGATVKESFDVASLKGLASPPPERSAEGAPTPEKPRP